MTTAQENELLWRTGHFRNPRYPDLFNVTKGQALALAASDPIRTLAVKSYQEFSRQQLSTLTWVAHGRDCNCDGDAGPATAVLWSQPRCMHPDFPVDDDPQIAPLWARDEANWPDTCRREILVGRVYDALPNMSKIDTDKVYWALCNNWTAAMQDVEMTPRNDQRNNSGLRMFHRVESMSGSTLAYHYLARNRCDDLLDGAWNSSVKWTLDLASAVGTHECGHGLGLNHVGDQTATMYYAITSHSRGRYGYPNATDIRAMEALGYRSYSNWEARRPTTDRLFVPRGDEPVPPGPPPVPPTGGVLRWPVNGLAGVDGKLIEVQLAGRTAVLLEKASV